MGRVEGVQVQNLGQRDIVVRGDILQRDYRHVSIFAHGGRSGRERSSVEHAAMWVGCRHVHRGSLEPLTVELRTVPGGEGASEPRKGWLQSVKASRSDASSA
jgi:hypothetical protein